MPSPVDSMARRRRSSLRRRASVAVLCSVVSLRVPSIRAGCPSGDDERWALLLQGPAPGQSSAISLSGRTPVVRITIPPPVRERVGPTAHRLTRSSALHDLLASAECMAGRPVLPGNRPKADRSVSATSSHFSRSPGAVDRLDLGTSRWYKRVLSGFRKPLRSLMFAQQAPNPLLGTNAFKAQVLEHRPDRCSAEVATRAWRAWPRSRSRGRQRPCGRARRQMPSRRCERGSRLALRLKLEDSLGRT
jgi:hypothetical protein